MLRYCRTARPAMALLALVCTVVLTGINQQVIARASTWASDADAAAPAAPAAPGLTFGVADNGLAYESAAAQKIDISDIKAIGLTSIRIDADWSWVQPNGPADFDWSVLDQEVTNIRAAGLTVDLIIDGCPAWAAAPGAPGGSTSQPASAAQFASYAADVAERYAPEGVRYFEIWNEPNIAGRWLPEANPVTYTKALIASYKAIKKIDKSAFIISGGLAPSGTGDGNYSPVDFVEGMYNAGAKGNFDALGDHPYTFPEAPDTAGQGSAWSQISGTNPSIISIMEGNGDSAKKIWMTEFGAPTTGSSSVGTAGQATEIAQALGYARTASWIGAIYIYTWQDSSSADPQDNGFGLISADGRPKPACGTVAAVLKRQQGSKQDGRFVLKKLAQATACSFLSS